MKQEVASSGGEIAGCKAAAGGNEADLVAGDDPAKDPSKKKSWRDDDPEAHKYTMLQAIGFNTMNMFGTGPLITIPYCINAVSPKGPQALIGYTLAVIACTCDSLVWSEISTMWPQSGGSYVYLRQLFGPQTWGRLASFMFIWQFFVSGPAEVASGFIAIAEYMVYFNEGALSYWPRVGIALFSLMLCFGLLFRGVHDIGRVTLVLWAVTIFSMLYTIPAGFSDWDPKNLEMPPGALSNPSKAVWAIAAATRFGVYDMSGYYDVCFMGGEVKNPQRTMPISCIVTCVVVGIIFILIYIAVLGHVPWQYMVEVYGDEHANPIGIMSIFTESRSGVGMAYVMTFVVAITIFGSVFSVLCGFGYLPYAAAKDGTFFAIFAHESEYFPGLADYSLMSVCFLSGIWCFFELEIVVNAMTTMMVAVMFIGQAVGLLYYRYTVPEDKQMPGWRMPLFPFPVILQIVIFFFIWFTTDSVLLWGSKDPVLEMSVAFLAVGLCLFLLRARLCQEWPFVDPPPEEDLEHAAKELVDDDSEDDHATDTVAANDLASEGEAIKTVEDAPEEAIAYPERICRCGSHLMVDCRFCRMCGVRWKEASPDDISLDFMFDDELTFTEAAPKLSAPKLDGHAGDIEILPLKSSATQSRGDLVLAAILAEACTQTSEPSSKPVSEASRDANGECAAAMPGESSTRTATLATAPVVSERAGHHERDVETPEVTMPTTADASGDFAPNAAAGRAEENSEERSQDADDAASDNTESDKAESAGASSGKSGSATSGSKSTSCGGDAVRVSSGVLDTEDGVSEAASGPSKEDDEVFSNSSGDAASGGQPEAEATQPQSAAESASHAVDDV